MNHKNPIVGICRHALVVVAALIVPLAVASPALARAANAGNSMAPNRRDRNFTFQR